MSERQVSQMQSAEQVAESVLEGHCEDSPDCGPQCVKYGADIIRARDAVVAAEAVRAADDWTLAAELVKRGFLQVSIVKHEASEQS